MPNKQTLEIKTLSSLSNNMLLLLLQTEAAIVMLLITSFVILLYVTKHSIHKTDLPPGPTPWPILGCLPQMLYHKKKSISRWIHRFMEEKGLEIATFRFGKVHVFAVTSPAIAREILKKQDAIFASRPESMATRKLSGGYLTTALSPYGETWKKMRRVLASEILSPARHQWLHHKRAQESDSLLKYLYHQSKNGGVVDVRAVTRHYAGNLARQLMFNKRYFGLERQDGGPNLMELEYMDATFKILKHIYAFCISDYLPTKLLSGLDLDGHGRTVKEAHKTILKFHEPIIDERIQKRRNSTSSSTVMMETQDLLDVLISLKGLDGEPLLTREDIVAQATEVTMTAIDNPSNAVEWAMAEMINSPRIMNKALEEIDRVVGKDRLVQEKDIPNLNYIKACVRECFRLHPVTPFNVPHVSMCDTVVAGYHIPKGSHVLLSRMGLGRNPRVWDDPLMYKPERHLDQGQNIETSNSGFVTDSDNVMNVSLVESELRFISFSTGRRSCVGIELGTTITLMLLARMLQGFSWKLPPNVSKINLEESEDDLYLRQPLIASIEPRLSLHLYP